VAGTKIFRKPAEEIAAQVGAKDNPDLVNDLNEGLKIVNKQSSPTAIGDQITGLSKFLAEWGVGRIGGKLNLRLAITIGKSDLFRDKNPNYDAIMGHLGPKDSCQEWQKALRQVSETSKRLLLNLGESALVQQAENEFRHVGFFFISSLGRGTETFVEEQSPATTQTVEIGMTAAAPGMLDTAPIAPLPPQPQGEMWQWVRKRVKIDEEGTRQPRPQHVLWPLLWILTA
jgi:hypothetical protein